MNLHRFRYRVSLFIGCTLISGVLYAQRDLKNTGVIKMKYPSTKAVDVVDVYHGRKVADPYRWLEDTESAETAEWIAAENKITQEYLQ